MLKLTLLKDVVCKDLIEADLWEDVAVKALVGKIAVKLLVKGLVFQALRLESFEPSILC